MKCTPLQLAVKLHSWKTAALFGWDWNAYFMYFAYQGSGFAGNGNPWDNKYFSNCASLQCLSMQSLIALFSFLQLMTTIKPSRFAHAPKSEKTLPHNSRASICNFFRSTSSFTLRIFTSLSFRATFFDSPTGAGSFVSDISLLLISGY